MTEVKFNKFRVYKKESSGDEDQYMFVSQWGFWSVGTALLPTTSSLYHPGSGQTPTYTPPTPPYSGWKCVDGQGKWQEDVSLQVLEIAGKCRWHMT